MAVETGLMTLHEDELQGILQVLAQIARTNDASKDKLDPGSFQSRLSTLPRRARFTVSQALSALAAQAPAETSDKPTLLKLAEHIAVRFALESYERGDLKVNAVRQMLDEMNSELDGLRKILGVYEEKMAAAGIQTQSHMEVLAQEFWAQVPEEKKKTVLESADAWCVPALRMREYVDELFERGENDDAEKILKNYASCLRNKNREARRQTAMGLAELAGLYAKTGEQLFVDTIREIGLELAEEKDPELQSLVGAAFVRMSQEAAKTRSYAAIQRSVELIDYVESERPGIGKSLRPRIGVENRLPEFIDESLKNGSVPSGLKDLIRRIPEPAAEQLAHRFSRVGFREDCEILMSMMEVLGPDGLEHLRNQLRNGSPSTAIDALGILVRMDLDTVEKMLAFADAGVEADGARSRGAADRFEWFTGARATAAADIRFARSVDSAPGDRRNGHERGEVGRDAFAAHRRRRLATGRDGVPAIKGHRGAGAAAHDGRGSCAAQSRRDTQGVAVGQSVGTARGRGASDGEDRRRMGARLHAEKRAEHGGFFDRAARQRSEFFRDPAAALSATAAGTSVSASTTNLKENCDLEIPELALGGGVAVCEQSLHPGSVVDIRLNSGSKPMKAQTIVRDANTQARAFEVVDMDLEDRAKLRKLLVQLGTAARQTSAQERSRRSTRTITTGGKDS